jgi:hypothetical protein
VNVWVSLWAEFPDVVGSAIFVDAILDERKELVFCINVGSEIACNNSKPAANVGLEILVMDVVALELKRVDNFIETLGF